MFFSRMLLFAMLAIVTLNFGCGLSTGEKTAPKKPPTYNGDNFMCVGKIPEYFDKYVNDNMSNEEITAFIQCIQKAFTTFAQLTRGRDETIYTPNEIRSFLHDFFLGKRRITDDLLAEVMLIKRAVIGGSGDHITRAELYQVVEALEDLRKEAIRIKPYLKVLNPNLAVKEDPARLGVRLSEAKNALRQSIEVLQQRMQNHKCDYPLKDLRIFLIEARAFVGWEQHFGDKAIPVDNWINFLKIFRELTVVPADPTVVGNQDWAPMLLSFSDWYITYLRYRVGVKDRPIFEGVGLQNTIHLGRDFFTLIEKSLELHPSDTVSFEKLTELTNALHGLRWIPKLRAASFQSSLRAIILRVFGKPEVMPKDRKDEGLNPKVMSRVREVFENWASVQRTLYLRKRTPETVVSKAAVPNMQLKPFLNPDRRALLAELANADYEEFNRQVGTMQPLFPDGLYRVLLVSKGDTGRLRATHDFHNDSMMNLLRLVTKIIFMGYANTNGGKLGWDAGITSEEMQKFFEDFREAGIDLGWVDRRKSDTGARAFIEGNLFNYSSDGLNSDGNGNPPKLNFKETMEMFAFLWSGGKMAEDAYEILSKQCRNGTKDDGIDDMGRAKLARDCVQEKMPAALNQLLETMPGLRQFLQLAPSNVMADYVRVLLETSFSKDYSLREWVELSELSMFMVVLHYAEAVLTKYDTNRDGSLTDPELDEAGDVFLAIIKKLTKEQVDKNVVIGFFKDTFGWNLPSFAQTYLARGAFHYMLKYREIPVGLWDVFWVPGAMSSLNLNRSELSAVFRVIIVKIVEMKKDKANVAVVPTQGEKDALNAACHDYMKYRLPSRPSPILAGQTLFHIIPPSCRPILDLR